MVVDTRSHDPLSGGMKISMARKTFLVYLLCSVRIVELHFGVVVLVRERQRDLCVCKRVIVIV